eukprot:INCI5045.13.p1 GENE.INCI5045.13~~INCI5045.13.p1  ORF type:complete len:189 (+),score=24.97 INCI5045.13:748-1314(+)
MLGTNSQRYYMSICSEFRFQSIGIGDAFFVEIDAFPDDAGHLFIRTADSHSDFPCVDNNRPSTIASSGALLSILLPRLELDVWSGRGLYSHVNGYVMPKKDLNHNFMNFAGRNLPFACQFWDSACNVFLLEPMGILIRHMILDAHPPALVCASLRCTSSSTARIGTNITIAFVAIKAGLLAGYEVVSV